MTFASRQDAGRRLAEHLLQNGVRFDVVVGLPRGGVVVAAEIAQKFQVPLDVLVVRKIGHPRQREFAVGALAQGGVMILDRDIFAANPWNSDEIQMVMEEETKRLQAYQRELQAGDRPALAGKNVLLVDDGLATGATMEAAILVSRNTGAEKTSVAVPVASVSAAQRICQCCERLFALEIDPAFRAVGCYYRSFDQTSTAEVLELLKSVNAPPSGPK